MDPIKYTPPMSPAGMSATTPSPSPEMLSPSSEMPSFSLEMPSPSLESLDKFDLFFKKLPKEIQLKICKHENPPRIIRVDFEHSDRQWNDTREQSPPAKAIVLSQINKEMRAETLKHCRLVNLASDVTAPGRPRPSYINLKTDTIFLCALKDLDLNPQFRLPTADHIPTEYLRLKGVKHVQIYFVPGSRNEILLQTLQVAFPALETLKLWIDRRNDEGMAIECNREPARYPNSEDLQWWTKNLEDRFDKSVDIKDMSEGDIITYQLEGVIKAQETRGSKWPSGSVQIVFSNSKISDKQRERGWQNFGNFSAAWIPWLLSSFTHQVHQNPGQPLPSLQILMPLPPLAPPPQPFLTSLSLLTLSLPTLAQPPLSNVTTASTEGQDLEVFDDDL